MSKMESKTNSEVYRNEKTTESRERKKRLPLTNDIVFKAVYGQNTPESQAALRALLNRLLQREQNPIEWVHCENPFSYRQHLHEKETIMDIKARLSSGEMLNLEMQMGTLSSYVNRSVFYLGKLIGQSLARGENYDRMRQTIVISIVNGALFPDSVSPYSTFYLMERDSHRMLSEITQLRFLELAKIDAEQKSIQEMSPCERIGAYFKYGSEKRGNFLVEELRQYDQEVISLTEPIWEEISEDKEMQMWAEDHDKYVRTVATARSEGRTEGLTEGLTEAILEILSELGPVPDTVRQGILAQANVDVLKSWTKVAAKVASPKEFANLVGLTDTGDRPDKQ